MWNGLFFLQDFRVMALTVEDNLDHNISGLLLELNLNNKSFKEKEEKFNKKLDDDLFVPCRPPEEYHAFANSEANVKEVELMNVHLLFEHEVKDEVESPGGDDCVLPKVTDTSTSFEKQAIKKEISLSQEVSDFINTFSSLSVKEEPEEDTTERDDSENTVSTETYKSPPVLIQRAPVTQTKNNVVNKKKWLHMAGCIVTESEDRSHGQNIDTAAIIADNLEYLESLVNVNAGSPDSGLGSPQSDSCPSPLQEICHGSLISPSPTSVSLLNVNGESAVKNISVSKLNMLLESFEQKNRAIPEEEKEMQLNDINEVCSRELNSIESSCTISANSNEKNANSNENGSLMLNNVTPVNLVINYMPVCYMLFSGSVPSTNVRAIQKARPLMPKPPETDNPARQTLEKELNCGRKEAYKRVIYNDIRENLSREVVHIVDVTQNRTNLHLAVINSELEHVFCLVEIHRQFHNETLSSSVSIADIWKKTACDYAKEANNQKLVDYLEHAVKHC